jgi:hypothetical protein
VRLTLPSERVKLPDGQKLTREQETEAQQRRGRAVREMLETVIQSRGYQRLDDAARTDVLERTIDRARRRESARLRREFPQRSSGSSGRAQEPRGMARIRAVAAAKFAGVSNAGKTLSMIEVDALIPELSESAGRPVTREDVIAEARRRGLRVARVQ